MGAIELSRIAEKVAARLGAQGALAVAVVGSVARGDTHDGSDVDITAIGEGVTYALEIVDDVLVSVSWKTPARLRELFDSPLDAGGVVPSWREARVLHDPSGIGASLQKTAQQWTWDRIAVQCDRVVAREMTGWAEEVFRLVGVRAAGETRVAAVMRVLLATGLPKLMAAHHRLFYDSENALWELVGSVMGHDWERDFDIALGLLPGGADLAALALFRQAAVRVERVLSPSQRTVVAAAVAISERAS
jgi:predicted nucleotidyltransferase